MSYFVIVRGPLGVGKTTVSRKLAEAIRAVYISVDAILDDHRLWDRGRLREFLAANRIAARLGRSSILGGTPVIFDGNFYWKTQIQDLARRLRATHYIFTLKAPLRVCIERDGRRLPPHGPEAAAQVHAKVTAFECGQDVDAARPVDAVVRDIVGRIATYRSGDH
jgi:predicted kinase